MASTKQKILIVDDNPINIRVLVETLRDNYLLSTAINGKTALKYANSDNPPDLILLDIMMPEMDGYEVIQRLYENEKTRDIPVIFVTAMNEEKDEFKGFELGSVDYITKPISKPIVQARVKIHLELKRHRDNLEGLVKEQTQEIYNSKIDIVRRLARAAEYRDNETGLHVVRMSTYSSIIGQANGMSQDEGEVLYHAASMHDVGKIGIPDSILLKPAKLTDEEFEIMKTHTLIGFELLKSENNDLLKMASGIAIGHHEKWDGSGYPKGIKGEDIPIGGRIASICDVFDALTSERPYKKAWLVEDTIEFMKEQKAKHFDPDLLELFFNNMPLILETKEKFSEETLEEN